MHTPTDGALVEHAKEVLAEAGYVFKKVTRVPDDLKRRLRGAQQYGTHINDWEMFIPFSDDRDIQDFLHELISKGGYTLVSVDRLYVLKTMYLQAMNLPGEVWEAGTYRGGTAFMFRRFEQQKAAIPATIRLFDTFDGMPETDPLRDVHAAGDFGDTSLAQVRQLIGEHPWVHYHPGFIPATFRGLEANRIRFAHIDLDIYEAIVAASHFMYPRMVPGGIMVYDDYGFFTCPGARDAVDEFFADKPEKPLVLSTGQALVMKL
jgi:O-methyltransferase